MSLARRADLPLIREGRCELRRRLGGVGGERSGALDQHDTTYALRKGRRHQRRDAGAHRVTDERKFGPTEGVGRSRHLGHPINEMVRASGWPAVRPAVSGEIERHQVQPGKQRRQTVEARRVVEPAVEREHRLTILRSPLAGGETKMRKLEIDVATAHR